ncbi:MAG: ATP-binding protein [Deltaproteobacteria bacterium]|nr:ATP-binding protein [Deltaproteobacteria bacterium]
MDLVDLINPSLTTLLLVMLLPFLYFGYHAKYWYNPPFLKRSDFFLMMLALCLGAVVIVKMIRALRAGEQEDLQLILMHLAPVLLVLLIVRAGKVGIGPRMQAAPNAEDATAAPGPSREIKRVTWDELIIDEGLKHELISIVELLKDPKTTRKYGIDVPKGILLTGPPGTGKTTIAKVIASTANLSFFVLSMDEIVSKWVGESEKNLTRLFDAARAHAPSVIFVDEVDSIGRARSSGGQQWAENLLNHLLQLIDGVVKTEGLYVIAATNRADLVDDALKRAGRLNKVIEIPLPDFNSRRQIFMLNLAKMPLAEQIDIDFLAHVTEGNSGADIKEICNQAGLNAFKRESGKKKRSHTVCYADIELALSEFVKG